MKNNNLLKILVPIIAVVVIFESIMVVSNLSSKKTVVKESVPVSKSFPSVTAIERTPIDLVFATENREMKIGNVYTVELNMVSKNGYALDALDLYVKYDKSAFDVNNLTFGPRFPKPTFSKISTLKSLLVANFLINDQSGLKIIPNEVNLVAKFEIKPKKAGNFDFEINLGDANKESATLFVENGTSSVLPFTSNKLTVKVTR